MAYTTGKVTKLPEPQACSDNEIAEFVTLLNLKLGNEHRAQYPTLPPRVWEIDGRGAKYQRIVCQDNQRMCYAFVERATGYIYKPDGYKKPAKHARGALHDEVHGLDCCGLYGVAYLR